ncbi:MAG: hypothetical protein JJU36_09305 [Phycisphaeraceae bacterium]|nr:hypothetical protein [Phycisphaeraceae bacterium]
MFPASSKRQPFATAILLLIFALCWHIAPAAAMPQRLTWTFHNPTEHDYTNQPLRLGMTLPVPFRPSEWLVRQDGQEIPWQVEIMDGDADEVRQGVIWVLANCRRFSQATFTLERGASERHEATVRVIRDGGMDYILDNGTIAVRLPTPTETGRPGPIQGIRRDGGRWIMSSRWEQAPPIDRLDVELTEPGPVFARAVLRYRFLPGLLDDEGSEMTMRVTLFAGRNHAEIHEKLNMGRDHAWKLDLSEGWHPGTIVVRPFGQTEADSAEARMELRETPPEADVIEVAQMRLSPHWLRSPRTGWFYGHADRDTLAGVIAARAGLWKNPFDGIMPELFQEQFGKRWLRFPTRPGERFWLLMVRDDPGEPVRLGTVGPLPGVRPAPGMRPGAAPPPRLPPPGGGPRVPQGPRGVPEGIGTGAAGTGDPIRHMVVFEHLASLDKLARQYLTEYLGRREGRFGAEWTLGPEAADPRGEIEEITRSMVRRAQEQSIPRGSGEILSNMQVRLDPDYFPHYFNGWSPPTATEGTILTRMPVVQAMSLRDHPSFDQLRQLAVNALETDMAYSITMPGGAGQDPPGLMTDALQTLYQLREVSQTFLDFDIASTPRYQAAARFLMASSVPDGDGRRVLPLGDVDPTKGLHGQALIRLIRDMGDQERMQRLHTAEFPGFGVIFRHDTLGPRETLLAFKSGPNRAGYQGDQLAIHYVGHRQRMAVAHMTTPENRASQEHMHNRVAFSTRQMPFADIGGYERLIAFRRTGRVDAAIGRVESSRMHEVPRLPPAPTHHFGPYRHFDEPIVYQRTVVFIRTNDRRIPDYVVIRDEFQGPAVDATYCLHVDAANVSRRDNVLTFGDTMTLGVAYPEEFGFEEFNWTNPRGPRGPEATTGVRLTIPATDPDQTHGQFITVLYPDARGPRIASRDNSITLTFPGGRRDVISFPNSALDGEIADGAVLVRVNHGGQDEVILRGRDVNLNRSQGEIGLFQHQPGTDFGPIPDWLLQQRADFPPPTQRNLLNPHGN